LVVGLPPLLLLIVSVLFSEVPVDGVKVTVIVQDWPTANVPTQLFVWEKSPPSDTLVIDNGAPPTLFTTNCCGWADELTFVVGKLKEPGSTVSDGAVPFP
jgi:hypothetical protein